MPVSAAIQAGSIELAIETNAARMWAGWAVATAGPLVGWDALAAPGGLADWLPGAVDRALGWPQPIPISASTTSRPRGVRRAVSARTVSSFAATHDDRSSDTQDAEAR